jgi:NAD(P)-dependent dehydrogenase (short-subunit alcohol dehydrogenase family)
MQQLEGKTILITGGTAGIGKACAEAMLIAGAEAVVINGRSRERGERALAAIKDRFADARISLVLGDMARLADAQSVVDAAVEKLGRIDILVNSTGTNDFPALLHKIAIEDVPGILQRCLQAQLLSCRAALPHMREANSGCIINIASDAAKIPTPGESMIGAAMAGIVMFTRVLAIEGKRHGIRANVLTPSIVGGTEFYERLMADPFAGRLFGKAGQKAELGLVNMTDVAEVAVFLASPAASKMTGQALSITGGISAL